MGINLPLPLFVSRRIVRANPWLLSDDGRINRPVTLNFGLFTISSGGTFTLQPEVKQKLLAERDAGTLFPQNKDPTST